MHSRLVHKHLSFSLAGIGVLKASFGSTQVGISMPLRKTDTHALATIYEDQRMELYICILYFPSTEAWSICDAKESQSDHYFVWRDLAQMDCMSDTSTNWSPERMHTSNRWVSPNILLLLMHKAADHGCPFIWQAFRLRVFPSFALRDPLVHIISGII